MAALSIDTEFMQYWLKLTPVEKESLLTVAKNYVQLKEEVEDAEDTRRRLIEEERNAYLSGKCKAYSWEQVKDMARHKDQRHGL